ncbi:M24 family metallopeptidase [Flavobacterium crassostreae]|uniref:Aminopeptidase n=1 Tax=Flavobacterium crassostreae TaxID=1763534 RepID=A0A1B9E3P1_9FLAO|nr:M24 family metallopeptidase [Flavobacterium crassostreae]OCB76518.1 aminopeptidase [Flavobacterium crassostreae]
MLDTKAQLIHAEKIAQQLFVAIEQEQLIQPGKSEKELNDEIFKLADQLFGIKKFWHKRIVRSGANTLLPYDENPPNLILQQDDILFVDFGPILEGWEADFGRTYVIGNNPDKHKLKTAVALAWQEAKDWFDKHQELTGAAYWHYLTELAKKYGYVYGGSIGGHLIGHFPHENIDPENYTLYIHPENPNDLFLADANGNKREWILEIHFIDTKNQIGGFFEQLLT